MDGGLPFCRGNLRENFGEQSLTSQVDFRWALWKLEKQRIIDVCWTGEETSEATTSNVASQISSLETTPARNVV